MPYLDLPIIKGDKVANNTDYRDSLPVNFTAVSKPLLRSAGYLISHPGLTEFGSSVGIDRGGYWNERQNRHYRVSGNSLVTIDENGESTTVGSVLGSSQASLTHSFNSQAVVSGGNMYLVQNDGTFSQVTDPNLGNPIDITWIDGYYFLTDGEFVYHTNLTNESEIEPLQFATAEFDPDPTLAVDTTSDNQVIVFGRYSTEYFINRATENFAFQRIQGKAVKAGVVGTHCETELEGSFYILGGGREESVSLHVISAGTYQSIATREVDKIISEYTESQLSTAILETRVEDRDRFIVVQLPGHTLLYNATIAKERGIRDAWTIVQSGLSGDRWRGVNGVYDPRISEWVYGDRIDNRLGLLDKTGGTQYGEIVESILFTPFFYIETGSIDELELEIIPGHQVNDEHVTCAISLTYDGVTFGKEWWATYGNQYQYMQRFIAYRLGYVRDWASVKVRAASRERLAFSNCRISYG
jgi:hypothetical protein